MDRKPAFEIIDRQTGKRIAAIFADGTTEGLPSGVHINRIPLLIAEAVAAMIKQQQELRLANYRSEAVFRAAWGR